jgi:hypothetical protein
LIGAMQIARQITNLCSQSKLAGIFTQLPGQLHTITMTGVSALTQSSPAGAEVMIDEFFNKWTRDTGSGAWTDEDGGRTFDSPEYIRIKSLQTLDGKTWKLRGGYYWVNSKREFRQFRPAWGSDGWRFEYFRAWESDDGELTLEWPSRRRLPPATLAGARWPAAATRIDKFFHIWTRAASGGWVDEYGGRTADSPEYDFEMRTADGKRWRWCIERLWISRGGEWQRQKPLAGSVAGEWSQKTVQAWTSSDGDVCLGWPSKVLLERQQGAVAN